MIGSSFLKFSCDVKSETISMNSLYSAKLKLMIYFILSMDVLLIHDFVPSSYIDHLENTHLPSLFRSFKYDTFNYSM
jgi:hypothetical protein